MAIDSNCKAAKEEHRRAASMFLACRRYALPTPKSLISISTPTQLLDTIDSTFRSLSGNVGLLLSSGMDSAVLAAQLPPGSIAYTLDFNTPQHLREHFVSEFKAAAQYVPRTTTHKRIEINRNEYFENLDLLTERMQRPTVPHEPALFKLILQAQRDGIDHLVTGLGADAHLGGLLSFYRASTLEDFQQYLFSRYINPEHALKDPHPIDKLLQRYTANGVFNVQKYLEEIGTEGENISEVIASMSINHVAPYADMKLAEPVNLQRPEKELIQQAFMHIYKTAAPRKQALWVPYNSWLRKLPLEHEEFLPGLAVQQYASSKNLSFLAKAKTKALSSSENLLARMKGQRLFTAKRGFLIYSLKRHFEINTV